MSRIRILPEAVANQIAAGEVVERPASVVKELLENALDAGARSIRIEVEAGGKRMIRVTDDGGGMAHDDALLAFERHATSKLRTANDLLSIATLGFRGEALPSIASVSRLVLETRTAEEEQGTRIEFAGGRLIGVKPAGVPTGTTITVSDLFYSVPARRKFLKSETTELGHIASLVTHYALAHPERQFVLKTPSQEILNVVPAIERISQANGELSAESAAEPSANASDAPQKQAQGIPGLAERVYQLFGRAALDELLEIPPTSGPVRAAITEPDLEEAERSSLLTVSGFASRPQVQRPNRNGIYVFVNRRLVRDRVLLHAIHEAYRNILPPPAFPAVLLFVDLPHIEVDVNVHPAKVEVRFRHSQFVHDFARDAIRSALTRARPIPSFPAGTAASAQLAAAAAGAGYGSYMPSLQAPLEPVQGVPRAVIPPMAVPLDAAAAPAPYSDGGFELTVAPLEPEAQRLRFESGEAIAIGGDPSQGAGPIANEIAEQFRRAAAEPAGAQLAERPASAESLLDLKPLGQVNSSFIVAVNEEGLWIIDQHVAHERILFEQHLRARREGQMTGQRMLMPHIVELSPRQEVIFEQIAEELSANGFEVLAMGPRSVAIQATPAGISSADAEKLLLQILDGVERENQAISMDWLQSRIAATTACHAAIKVNMALDQTKMEWLLAELAKTEAPMSCPHGRPVVLRYSTREIERAFHRI
ncbi:MAG TPA: DNA mismatch repair endonuclease MutL [Candidatus Acidoferrales bacterium]|jgi:DNA mismatch repair protein MutL|nr:DNA mismatch repair endonuclease MutL [Candidatus Acidoferrales bacterium]